MTPPTTKALSDQEDLYAREIVEIFHSHAAKAVQEEQIQKYFSQRGIQEGHDIMNGEGVRVDRLGGHGLADTSSSGMSRNTTIQPDSVIRDNNDDSLTSLKMFVPPHAQSQSRSHDPPGYASSGATPLERFLTPGDSSEPCYMRRPAMMQGQYYGDMDSVETRARQAQALAEKVVNEGQLRRSYTQQSILGSTRDGFVYN